MKCPKCGSPVTPGHTFCPKCGQTFQWVEPAPKTARIDSPNIQEIPRIVWVAIAVAIIIIALGWAFSDIWLSKELGRAVNAPIDGSPAPTQTGSDKVNFENFQQIEQGMAYSDVCLLLGGSGTYVNNYNDQKDYEWTSPTGAVIIVTFRDERVLTKGSRGL